MNHKTIQLIAICITSTIIAAIFIKSSPKVSNFEADVIKIISIKLEFLEIPNKP